MRLPAHTKRWQDLFWNELHPYPKMILSYCYDNADLAGFIDYSCPLWLTQMKGKSDSRYPEFTKTDLLNSLSDLKEKLISDGKNKLFIKDFLKHQMKLPLKKGNTDDNQIILKLQSNLQRFNNAPEILEILNNIEEEKHIETVKKKPTKKKEKSIKLTPPKVEEFIEYFSENGFDEELARRAWRSYDSNDWKDSQDTPVRNWRQKCQNNWFRPENKKTEKEEKKSKLQTTMSVVEEMTRNPNK
jgi:hypothetical protein